MKRVIITRRLPEAGLTELHEAGLDVAMRQADEAPSRAELLTLVPGAHALVTLMSDTVDAELLDAAGPQLAVVANYAVGYDNVDLDACRDRGVRVANTPDVLTAATADFAFALLLAAARRVLEGDRLVRGGGWSGWQPQQLLGAQVTGAKLGIVGMGRIGSAVARRARAFELEVLYHNRSRDQRAERETGARWVDLEELLSTSDFVSLHCPLTPETHHLIDAAALAKLKPSAVLVNTARGPVVDEAALAEALAERQLAAAGLDVFEREPEVERRLLDLPNVVLSPHLGSATLETRTAMARLCAEAVVAVLAGREPKNLVA